MNKSLKRKVGILFTLALLALGIYLFSFFCAIIDVGVIYFFDLPKYSKIPDSLNTIMLLVTIYAAYYILKKKGDYEWEKQCHYKDIKNAYEELKEKDKTIKYYRDENYKLKEYINRLIEEKENGCSTHKEINLQDGD